VYFVLADMSQKVKEGNKTVDRVESLEHHTHCHQNRPNVNSSKLLSALLTVTEFGFGLRYKPQLFVT
jgi:hypothetical protein